MRRVRRLATSVHARRPKIHSSSTSWMPTAAGLLGSPKLTHGAGDGEHGVRLRRGGYQRPGSSPNATCRKARSIHSSPTRRHEYRTVAMPAGPSHAGVFRRRRARLLLTGTLMGGYGDDFPTAVPDPAGTNDRRQYRRPKRQHDLGRYGVHAQSRCPQGHLFREHQHGAQDGQGQQGLSAHRSRRRLRP